MPSFHTDSLSAARDPHPARPLLFRLTKCQPIVWSRRGRDNGP